MAPRNFAEVPHHADCDIETCCWILVACIDGAWAHRRNSTQHVCVVLCQECRGVIAIEYEQTERINIFADKVPRTIRSGNFAGAPQAMESAALRTILNRLRVTLQDLHGGARVRFDLAMDGDVKTKELVQDFPNIVRYIYRDFGHIRYACVCALFAYESPYFFIVPSQKEYPDCSEKVRIQGYRRFPLRCAGLVHGVCVRRAVGELE